MYYSTIIASLKLSVWKNAVLTGSQASHLKIRGEVCRYMVFQAETDHIFGKMCFRHNVLRQGEGTRRSSAYGHLPNMFVLLPDKTEATYRRMWEQIRLLCPLAQPKEMLLDFEKAAINSFEQV